MPSAGSEDRIAHRKHVLSIDLGSGGLKTAIVADTGSVVASVEVPLTTHLLPGGGAEQGPAEWWQGVRQTARQAITESGLAPDDIVAVACDSQWSVAVPVDDHGDPLMRAVHWMDTRGGPYNRAIANGFPRIQGYGLFKLLKWLRLTGLAPTLSGVDSLGHVLFIQHAYPEIYARTHKFLEPMDFLTSRLTGRITATQKTMVPFVVTDNRRWGTTAYSDSLLAMAGLEKTKFPTLIDNDGVDPVTGTFDGLPEGAIVTIAGKSYRLTYEGGEWNAETVEDAQSNVFHKAMMLTPRGQARCSGSVFDVLPENGAFR